MTNENDNTLRFEEALAALEEVVEKLEGGEMALDEMVALYERGKKLRARCAQLLEEAHLRIEKLDEEGKVVAAPELVGKDDDPF